MGLSLPIVKYLIRSIRTAKRLAFFNTNFSDADLISGSNDRDEMKVTFDYGPAGLL
jgi:hypothetical protein